MISWRSLGIHIMEDLLYVWWNSHLILSRMTALFVSSLVTARYFESLLSVSGWQCNSLFWNNSRATFRALYQYVSNTRSSEGHWYDAQEGLWCEQLWNHTLL